MLAENFQWRIEGKVWSGPKIGGFAGRFLHFWKTCLVIAILGMFAKVSGKVLRIYRNSCRTSSGKCFIDPNFLSY